MSREGWMRREFIGPVCVLILVAGCGGGDRDVARDAIEDTPVVLPGLDPGGDPGAGAPDGGVPRDLPFPDDGQAVFADPGEGDAGDAAAADGTADDAGAPEAETHDVADATASEDAAWDDGVEPPVDPGPVDVDAGHDLVEGACAPGQTTCWCVDETQCDPAYDRPCRPNRCNPRTGHCVLDSGFLEGRPCDDGDPCTTGEACAKGICTGGTVTCECRNDGECVPDADPCTDDRCIDWRCVHPVNTAPCDDGDGCTAGDACLDGACVPGIRVCECDGDARCDDGVDCTDDRCVDGTCARALAPDHCLIAGVCVPAGTAEPGNACRACDPGLASDAWSDVAPETPCEDGDACTTPDACREGACVPGMRVCECADASFCDDGNPCTDDACVDFACVHLPNALGCEDGDFATIGDRCIDAACVPGPYCGDAACARPEETCATCPGDCGGPCPPNEVLCTDGWDDDLDGTTDCVDDDCRFDAPCVPPNVCAQVDDTVNCGFDLNYEWSLSNDLKGTACGVSLGGDDTVWKFTSATTREVTFRVEDPTSNRTMSAIVLAGACNGDACIRAATGDPAIVTFTALAGRTYYLVYDEIVYMARVRARVTCP
jgi:hypothetical protein